MRGNDIRSGSSRSHAPVDEASADGECTGSTASEIAGAQGSTGPARSSYPEGAGEPRPSREAKRVENPAHLQISLGAITGLPTNELGPQSLIEAVRARTVRDFP